MAFMGQTVLPPGFRFHPTDEELVAHYLRRRACGRKFEDDIIGEVDLYKFEPWDLPDKCILRTRDPEWYFFNARDKKYPNGSRTNRATEAGYWKATGKDRKVTSGNHTVGMKKTLVFYLGRAPHGERTDWVMHEFRLDEEFEKTMKNGCAFVLCRIHKKSGPGPKNGEQYGAPVLDENDEIVPATDCSLLDDVDQKLPQVSQNEIRQGLLEVFNQPVITGGLEDLLHDSNNVDCAAMESLNSGEDLETFLQCLLSHESQDEETGLEAAQNVESPYKWVFNKAGTVLSDHVLVSAESSGNHCGNAACSEATQSAPMVVIPDISELDVHGIENLHDILHPAPEESEMLEELGQTLVTNQGDTTASICNPSNHLETMIFDVNGFETLHHILHPAPDEAEILEALFETLVEGQVVVTPSLSNTVDADEVIDIEAFPPIRDVVGDDYLELADLEYPLDESLLALPALESGEFVELESSGYEDTGIEICSRSIWVQEGLQLLHEQGTADRRIRLQMPALHMTGQHYGETIYETDPLQCFGQSNSVHEKSLSSEVPMLTSGDLKDFTNIELHSPVDMYNHNGYTSFTYLSPGSGLNLNPRRSAEQMIQYSCIDLNYNYLADQMCIHAELEREDGHVELSQAGNPTGPDLLVKDLNSIMDENSPTLCSMMDSHTEGMDESSIVKAGLCSGIKSSSVNMLSCVNLTASSDGLQHGGAELVENTDRPLPKVTPCFGPVGSLNVSLALVDLADTVHVKPAPVAKDRILIRPTKKGSTLEKSETTSTSVQDQFIVVDNIAGPCLPEAERGSSIDSPSSSRQPTDSHITGALPVVGAGPSLSTTSAPSTSQSPKSIFKILEFLGNVPAMPASAAELPVDPYDSACEDPWASKFRSTSGPAKGKVTFRFKVGTDHLQASLPGRLCQNTSAGLSCRPKSDISAGKKHWPAVSEKQREHCYTANCEGPELEERFSKMSVKDHRKLCKCISSGLTVFLFRLATYALIFFCLLRGFCRLTKSALTIF